MNENTKPQEALPKKKTFFQKAWKVFKKLLLIFFVSLPFIIGGLYLAYQEYVVRNPGPHISKQYIQNLLTQDSPIHYQDGSIMNAISYKGTHRYLVEYDEIPENWINAIVAMEDKNFWTHHGIEPVGIGKAIYRNLRGIRSGGSTLTQQTAKNIFNRDQYQKATEEQIQKILSGEEKSKSRSVKFSAKIWAKAWEALNALRLEEHFSKEEIITYYANQFQVHGTGRGIGVAARYFFDKTPAELTLHECAFLAAIVKGPNNYNPFNKKTPETKAETIKKAMGRTQTVLNRMLEDGYITQEQKDAIYLSVIPFERGKFRFANSIVFELIQEELRSEAVQKALLSAGIPNISTAGVHIHTTIDEEIQRKSYYALRHTLTEHSGKLNDYPAKAPLRRPTGKRVRLSEPAKPFEFYEGIIVENKKKVIVDIGGEECVLTQKSISKVSKLISAKKTLRKRLKKYSRLLVSKNEDNSCSLELDGSLQGGLLATQEGYIRAIIGGRQNNFYNRATQSTVQLGSTWKPLLYASALQLGWSLSDQLNNHHSAFYYSGGWYFPSGHDPIKNLSILWTGVKSENRASIWLLHHLTDRLPIHRVKELAKIVGLTRKEMESVKEYKKRLGDWGIISSHRRWLNFSAFYQAQKAVTLAMEEGPEKLALMSIQYTTPTLKKAGIAKLKSEKPEDRKHNREVIDYNYLDIKETFHSCQEKRRLVAAEQIQTSKVSFFDIIQPKPKNEIPEGLFWNYEQQRIVCGAFDSKDKKIIPLTWEHIENVQGEEATFPQLWIYDTLSEETLLDIERKMEENRESLSTLDPYDLDFLLFHHDFVRLLNMRYLDYNVQRLGLPKNPALKTDSALELVQNMPLGAILVSLVDINKIYDGLVTGHKYTNTTLKRPLVIQKIIDSSGALVYEPKITKEQVFDPIIGKQVAHILYNVIQKGTGRRAKNKISHGKNTIPALGKTGTTNNSKRAAFVGFLPFEEDDKWNLSKGVTLSTTVGFDFERPLRGKDKLNPRRKYLSLDGAKGALPIWIESAQSIAQSNLLGEPSVTIPWSIPESFIPYEDQIEATNYRGKLITETAENWVYSEDKEHIYRVFNVEDSPSLIQKSNLPAKEVNIDDIDFEKLLEEEEEEE